MWAGHDDLYAGWMIILLTRLMIALTGLDGGMSRTFGAASLRYLVALDVDRVSNATIIQQVCVRRNKLVIFFRAPLQVHNESADSKRRLGCDISMDAWFDCFSNCSTRALPKGSI